MKKTIIFIFLSITFLTSSINAEEVKDKTYEELIAEFLETSKKKEEIKETLKQEKAKTLVTKKELKSAKEVNKKMDEVLNILTK